MIELLNQFVPYAKVWIVVNIVIAIIAILGFIIICIKTNRH